MLEKLPIGVAELLVSGKEFQLGFANNGQMKTNSCFSGSPCAKLSLWNVWLSDAVSLHGNYSRNDSTRVKMYTSQSTSSKPYPDFWWTGNKTLMDPLVTHFKTAHFLPMIHFLNFLPLVVCCLKWTWSPIWEQKLSCDGFSTCDVRNMNGVKAFMRCISDATPTSTLCYHTQWGDQTARSLSSYVSKTTGAISGVTS